MHTHTPHLQVLQRTHDTDQHKAGTFTADPSEIDHIVQQAWEPIYNGNQDDHTALVEAFFAKYDQYVFQAPTQTLPKITWTDIKWATTHNTDTAGGIDGWTKTTSIGPPTKPTNG